MPHASDSRSQYLSLALFSRQIIEALLELVRSGDRVKLSKALPNAIESLQAATDSRTAALTSVVSRIATSYDQVRTIDDLFPEDDRRKMIQTLQSLHTESADLAAQKAHALQAIRFFYKIENRSLRNSRQPSPRASRLTHGLCPAR
jgi:hypothetical protein